jgi:hypothetical protein
MEDMHAVQTVKTRTDTRHAREGGGATKHTVMYHT